jgi:hypothetical protein
MAKEKIEKARPRVSIRERRLQNPFGEPSQDIPLKDKSLACHWFSEAVRVGQISRVRELGWEHVTKEMVVDLGRLGFYSLGPGDIICRGERQQEFLMYMPIADRDAIQAAKTKQNIEHMKNPNAMRNEVLNSYGELDPNGADRIQATGGVTVNQERIEVRPELD